MDYAQSRIQARFGERPGESLWQRLETELQPVAALEIAHSCGLRRWVAGIRTQADSHAIEIALRARWRECVTEVTCWMPECWQPALLWTRRLVDLPALCHLARGGDPLPWMYGDPVLQVYARADPATRERMLNEDCRAKPGATCAPGPAPLPAGSAPAQLRQAWLDEWRRLWPRGSDTGSLEHLATLFDAATMQPEAIGRPELRRRLRSLFRSSVLSPVVGFVYIAFAALDIERLRAGLLRHALAREGIIPS